MTSSKTKTAWAGRKVHKDVVLPSGQEVDVQVPNLPMMLKEGNVPNALVDAAIQFMQAQEVTREMIEEQWDYIKWIVPLTIVAPKITGEDVGVLPAEDLDMIAAFAARTIDQDAVGNHLGGLHTNESWRRFRGQLSSNEIAALVS